MKVRFFLFLFLLTTVCRGQLPFDYKKDSLATLFCKKLNLKCKTTKNNIISSYKEDYFFDRKIREDRVLDDLDRLFQN